MHFDSMHSDNSPSLHILGAGAWGCALAIIYSRFSPFKTHLWSRKKLAENENFPRLPDQMPPKTLNLRQGFPAAADLKSEDIIFFVTPTQTLREICQKLPENLPENISLVTCCKGLERKTNLMPLDVLTEFFPTSPKFVLAGPNFAHEIAQNLPAMAAISGIDVERTQILAKKLSLPNFTLSPHSDPVGIQMMGAAKNVAAIGVGALMGAGLGENARAAFITCFIQEISLVIEKLSPHSTSLLSVGGIGDLLLTATSSASRNYALGEYLGKHKIFPPQSGTGKEAVTEGAFTAPVLLEIGKSLHVSLPAVEAVNRLLEKPSATEEIIRRLFSDAQGVL